MQVCGICRKPFNFSISIGEIVICKECEQLLTNKIIMHIQEFNNKHKEMMEKLTDS